MILSKINKYFVKNKISIIEIQKYLKKKGFSVRKKIKHNSEIENLGSISRTLLSSTIIISVFFILPIINEFTKERKILSKDFENNSKNEFTKTLENQEVKLD